MFWVCTCRDTMFIRCQVSWQLTDFTQSRVSQVNIISTITVTPHIKPWSQTLLCIKTVVSCGANQSVRHLKSKNHPKYITWHIHNNSGDHCGRQVFHRSWNRSLTSNFQGSLKLPKNVSFSTNDLISHKKRMNLFLNSSQISHQPKEKVTESSGVILSESQCNLDKHSSSTIIWLSGLIISSPSCCRDRWFSGSCSGSDLWWSLDEHHFMCFHPADK